MWKRYILAWNESVKQRREMAMVMVKEIKLKIDCYKAGGVKQEDYSRDDIEMHIGIGNL